MGRVAAKSVFEPLSAGSGSIKANSLPKNPNFDTPRIPASQSDATLPVTRLEEKIKRFQIAVTRKESGPPVDGYTVYGIKQKTRGRKLIAEHLALPKVGNEPVEFVSRMPEVGMEWFYNYRPVCRLSELLGLSPEKVYTFPR